MTPLSLRNIFSCHSEVSDSEAEESRRSTDRSRTINPHRERCCRSRTRMLKATIGG
jgi:hypothetical protein